MSDNNPWGKKETNEERINRLEEELKKLKADKDEPQKVEIVKTNKPMGCLTVVGILMLIGYIFFKPQVNNKPSDEDIAKFREALNNLEKRFTEDGVMRAQWVGDTETFYLFMKNPNETLAFKKAICTIGKDDYGFKYKYNIQIGLLKDYTKVGESYLCR